MAAREVEPGRAVVGTTFRIGSHRGRHERCPSSWNRSEGRPDRSNISVAPFCRENSALPAESAGPRTDWESRSGRALTAAPERTLITRQENSMGRMLVFVGILSALCCSVFAQSKGRPSAGTEQAVMGIEREL